MNEPKPHKLDSTCSQSPQNRKTMESLIPRCTSCGENVEVCHDCGMCPECAMEAGDEGEGICRYCADSVILYMKTKIAKKTEDTLPFPTFDRFPTQRLFQNVVFDWMHKKGRMPRERDFYCAISEIAWDWYYNKQRGMDATASVFLDHIEEIVKAMRDL